MRDGGKSEKSSIIACEMSTDEDNTIEIEDVILLFMIGRIDRKRTLKNGNE